MEKEGEIILSAKHSSNKFWTLWILGAAAWLGVLFFFLNMILVFLSAL